MRKMKIMEEFMGLPSPVSFSIWWNCGSILGFLLMLQIFTGLVLSMHYVADMVMTFDSVVHIMRDVSYGWLLRFVHANGASLFFFFMYLHIGRGIYYQSYLIQPLTWMVGVTIFLVSMGTAFLGYVLPWGQMSFWGATVITNLLSAIPYFGTFMVEWVWGGYSVGQSTLNRFFSLHFILPFLIAGLALVHLIFLHEKGSTNPLGEVSHIYKIVFHPYFTWKDIVGVLVLLMMLFFVCFFNPNLLTDPENFSMADPMVTPVHIQPEWYFLFAYAILRSIPSKLGGVVALAISVTILYILPLGGYLGYNYPSGFNLLYQILFWGLSVTFLLLTWLGSCPIEDPFLTLSKPMTVFYFFFYFALLLSSSSVGKEILFK